MLDANATVEWTPAFYSKRMDDWLRNMGDWNISRKRYFGLPLPFYPCGVRAPERDRLARRPRGARDRRPRPPSGAAPAVDRRRDDPLRVVRPDDVRRIAEVGDAWLDAGIVHFSTLGWRNETWVENGNATGAAAGLTGADLPDHAYWEKWFPADWVTESREQIRLWFYSQSFMAVTLEGRSRIARCSRTRRMRDEHGEAMHKSRGNAIAADEALELMGADVERWIFAAHPPNQNISFGYRPADEVKRSCSRSGTPSRSSSRTRTSTASIRRPSRAS